MKKLFLLLTFILVLPSLTAAQTYINEKGNFSVDIPDNWQVSIKNHDNSKTVSYGFIATLREDNVVGVIGIAVLADNNIPADMTFSSLPADQQELIITAFVKKIQTDFDDTVIKSTTIENFYGKETLFITASAKQNKRKVNIIFGFSMYQSVSCASTLITDDTKDKHKQDYYAVIKSFTPN